MKLGAHGTGPSSAANPQPVGHESAKAPALSLPIYFDRRSSFSYMPPRMPASFQMDVVRECLLGLGAIGTLLRCSASEQADFDNADAGDPDEAQARPLSPAAIEGLHAALGILAFEALCKVESAAEIIAKAAEDATARSKTP